ncbi:hypothetical protein MHBO_000791 [Bonamia ostreae]|uniref:LAGLIDADG homing endonuclease n=1 Tax=Bonamia ostreae TaxID=126728 RepID=A0ABV2AGU2_9EUKA
MITDLGRIVTDHRVGHFHNKKHIFPVGFKSERMFLDCQKPESGEKIKYFSEIVDTGGDFPVFRVRCDKYPNLKFLSATAAGAWNRVIESIKMRKKDLGSSKINGHEIFGYGNKTVKKLYEKLPGFDRCVKLQN